MTTMKLSFIAITCCLCGLQSITASAQNTGGVFGPVVNEGHQSFQYRAAFAPDSDAFAQRFHYQRSVDSQFMWRIVGQTRKTQDSEFDFDYVQGELFWHITKDNRPWQTGLRLDVRVRDGDRNETIGLNWMNQFKLSDGWQARLLALTSVDLGSDGRDGVGIQTRANIFRTMPDKKQFGVELFSSYGTTSDFQDFDDQSHTIGPFTVIPLNNGWSVFAGALFGLTDPSADSDLRVWITRSL